MWWAVVWWRGNQADSELALVWDTKAKDELVAALSGAAFGVTTKHVVSVSEAEMFHSSLRAGYAA